MESRRWALVLGLACLVAPACAQDPEVLKRQYVEQGDRFVAEGKHAEAIVAYRNAVSQDEKFGEARLKLSKEYQAARNYVAAMREAVRAADLMPKSVAAQLQAGILLLAGGRYEDAKTRASSILEIDPKHVQGLILMGHAMARLKDLDGAVTQVEEAIEQNPQRTLSYTNLGLLEIARGNQEAAEAAFKRAVEMQPNSQTARAALGNYYWAYGRRPEAERELKAALSLAPGTVGAERGLAAFYLSSTVRDERAQAEPHLKAYADNTTELEPDLLLADFYTGMGKRDLATPILERLAKQDNGLVPATVRLATGDFAEGRSEQAFQRLEAVLAKQPKNEPTLEAKARFLLAERKYAEALRVATAIVEANPKAVAGGYLRAVALEETGKIDQATQTLRNVLQFAPNTVPVQARLAALYLRTGNAKEALQLSTQVVKAQPRSVPGHLLHGRALLRSGDLRNAERELVAVVKATPASAEAHTWLGMLYEQGREPGAARQSYQKALDLEPNNNVAFAGLIAADIAEKKNDAARAKVESRLASRPRDPAVLTLAGMVYGALGDARRAESAYRTLLEVDADNMQAYGRLGSIYLAQKRLDEARRMFDEVAKQQQKPVAAKTMVAMILTLQNKRDEARKYYEDVVALDPRAVVAANNLAWDYAERGGNLDVALQLAQAAKSQLPDNPQISDTLGWVYYKKGMAAPAVTNLREAAEKNPSSASIHYHLGLAYVKSGNAMAGRQALERVLKLDPTFAQADQVRQTLASIKG